MYGLYRPAPGFTLAVPGCDRYAPHNANRMCGIGEVELLEDPHVSNMAAQRAYRDMASIQRWLGDVRFVVKALRHESLPVRKRISAPVTIIRAEACRDPLPSVDVAFCMYFCHHLRPADVVQLIRNLSRSCRRFILFDLVRHPLPLALFRMFVAPLICETDAEDGRHSIRGSYTPAEMHKLASEARAGSPAIFELRVVPLWFHQVLDIRFRPCEYEALRMAPLRPVEDPCPGW